MVVEMVGGLCHATSLLGSLLELVGYGGYVPVVVQIDVVELLRDERVLLGSLTSAIGVVTLLVAGSFVLVRDRVDRRSSLLLIVLGGGFTSVFTGLLMAAVGYVPAAAFAIAMAILYGMLLNFYLGI